MQTQARLLPKAVNESAAAGLSDVPGHPTDGQTLTAVAYTAAMRTQALPESVNYHLNKNCNFRCRGCYAVFNDEPFSRGVMLPREKMFAIVDAVAAAPLPEGKTVRKLTFAGGEPTLCPCLPELIAHAKSRGLVTMLVTNGSLCTREYLSRMAADLDWLTLSIDSLVPETNIAIGRADGRGKPLDAATYGAILNDSRALGIRTKVNTVVNSVNQHENLSDFLECSGIIRWKVLQVMAVAGQNDEHIAELAVSSSAFDAFVGRHAGLAAGIRIVPEPVEDIRGSYAMIDRHGRFFDSLSGAHRYSEPILQVGVARAFSQVSFDRDIFEERGGSYDFQTKGKPMRCASPDVQSLAAGQGNT